MYNHKTDNYADKGAGYFMLWRNGIEIEMLGRRGTLSAGTDCAPDLRGIPTLIRVSGVWVRAHANPGLYSRSR